MMAPASTTRSPSSRCLKHPNVLPSVETPFLPHVLNEFLFLLNEFLFLLQNAAERVKRGEQKIHLVIVSVCWADGRSESRAELGEA